jgi:hypothetical protein
MFDSCCSWFPVGVICDHTPGDTSWESSAELMNQLSVYMVIFVRTLPVIKQPERSEVHESKAYLLING